MKTEKTYLEMIEELYNAIETDSIPTKDKETILMTLNSLYDMLWVYSA